MLHFYWPLEREAVVDERSGSFDLGTLGYSSSGWGHWPLTEAQPSSSTYAGKTSQKVPSFFQGLDKEEMKRMVTVIMSAICYSHYMEAQYEGTFQKNMDTIFKKNNLHSVKFPDLIRTEGIKDISENIEAEMEDPLYQQKNYQEKTQVSEGKKRNQKKYERNRWKQVQHRRG